MRRTLVRFWHRLWRNSTARFSCGELFIPAVLIEQTGTTHSVRLRLTAENPPRFELTAIDPPLPWLATPVAIAGSSNQANLIAFTCNICGQPAAAPLSQLTDREQPSCACGSNLRKRSLIHALSMRLFGNSLALPDFPHRPDILGIGLSDWDGYASRLAAKLGYINTFYHTEPRLDITQLQPEQAGRYDFLISTEVFEHIPQPVERAFVNAYNLLKPGGILIFSVPYKKTGTSVEHFPQLHDYHLEEHNGERVLVNQTEEGQRQQFTQLIFHGGDGFTLEMRLFSAPDLIHYLERAGFEDIVFHQDHAPEFGIQWAVDWSLPISARRPL